MPMQGSLHNIIIKENVKPITIEYNSNKLNYVNINSMII